MLTSHIFERSQQSKEPSMRNFDSVELFFRLQDRWDRVAPYLLGVSAFLVLPIVAAWIEGR